MIRHENIKKYSFWSVVVQIYGRRQNFELQQGRVSWFKAFQRRKKVKRNSIIRNNVSKQAVMKQEPTKAITNGVDINPINVDCWPSALSKVRDNEVLQLLTILIYAFTRSRCNSVVLQSSSERLEFVLIPCSKHIIRIQCDI